MLRLIRDHGSRSLGDLTPTDVLRWCAGADSPRTLANNTIRGRTAVVATLLRWCARSGIPAPAPEYLTDSDSPLRQFRPTYGKAQSQNPPRWLTKEEAYSTLLNALDDTPMGRRDELVIRLGLAGVRAQEIVGLQIGNLRDLDTDHPSSYWTGKRYKPLHIALRPSDRRCPSALSRRLPRQAGRGPPARCAAHLPTPTRSHGPGPTSSPRLRNRVCPRSQRPGEHLEHCHRSRTSGWPRPRRSARPTPQRSRDPPQGKRSRRIAPFRPPGHPKGHASRRPGYHHEVLPRPDGHRGHGPGSEGSRLRRSYYFPARRCHRVAFSIFLCFFFRILLRRFFMREPTAGTLVAVTTPAQTGPNRHPLPSRCPTSAPPSHGCLRNGTPGQSQNGSNVCRLAP